MGVSRLNRTGMPSIIVSSFLWPSNAKVRVFSFDDPNFIDG